MLQLREDEGKKVTIEFTKMGDASESWSVVNSKEGEEGEEIKEKQIMVKEWKRRKISSLEL